MCDLICDVISYCTLRCDTGNNNNTNTNTNTNTQDDIYSAII